MDERAVKQLKFAEMLPPEMARRTVAARLADRENSILTVTRPIRQVH